MPGSSKLRRPGGKPGRVAATTLQWMISAYAVAFGGLLLLGGRLCDVYGRSRMYRIGLVAFVLASISGGLAFEPDALIASRVVQRIGRPYLPPGLSLLVTSWPGEQECSRALGVYGAVVSAGFASGAVLGGLLVLAVARAADTLRVTWPALMASASVVPLVMFVIREKRARVPLLDLGLFKDRGIAGANLALIAVGGFNAAQVLLVALYLQEGRVLSPVITGLCFIPQAAGRSPCLGPRADSCRRSARGAR